MTTALIHGDPGSYKTSSLVSDYLVSGIKQGRVIVTNIRGVKTCEEISEIYNFDLPENSKIIQVSFDSVGFEQMARFFHWAPEGAMILMDEGQRVYPTRLRDFSQYDLLNSNEAYRPKTVEDAFDSHRHMNWDIYISTPNIGKIHKEIRAVAEFGFRHKNLATVFSFMKGRYKRVTHNAENSGTSISHVISASIKKIDKRCFDVYQSTATGQTKDSATGFSFFKQPKVALLLLVIVYSAWNLGSTLFSNGGLPAILGGDNSNRIVQADAKNPKASVADVPLSFSVRGNDKNPFLGLTLYYVGSINQRLLFEVSYPDRSHIQIDNFDLAAFGFEIARISDNIVKLTFMDQTSFIFTKPAREVSYVPQNSEFNQNNSLLDL